MKKFLLNVLVLAAVFVATILVGITIINKDSNDITMEMEEASFPVLVFRSEGVDYNALHGYREKRDPSFECETVTLLDSDRTTEYRIDTYGRTVNGIAIEVRSVDGSRLIEHTELTQYNTYRKKITGKITLKDLLEEDGEYSLCVEVTLDDASVVYYYTRVLWNAELYFGEKMAFINDFHNKLFDKEEAKTLTRYLESNASLNDNSTLAKVDIHSSYQQISYGDLAPLQSGETKFILKDITPQTATVLVNYEVYSNIDNSRVLYEAQEYFRIRYTVDRTYLLDYERTLEQVPILSELCVNDKIILGITDTNVSMKENGAGTTVAFVADGQLFCYNAVKNSLATVFSFCGDVRDDRTVYGAHDIRILQVSEEGNVDFAVYGYMNRGRHEGEVGIELYEYSNSLNTIEELLYIPYGKTEAILAAELDRLLFMNDNSHLYLSLENLVYCVDLSDRSVTEFARVTEDGYLHTSDSNRILVVEERDESGRVKCLLLQNLYTETATTLYGAADETIRALGFMGEDLIYGVARNTQISTDSTGREIFPMYKLYICDQNGKLLKTYSEKDYYVEAISMAENQITLQRITLDGNGMPKEAKPDYITTAASELLGQNLIVAPKIDIYETYVQIQVKKPIDTAKLKFVTPQEMVFEGGRNLSIETEDAERYYVYSAYGIEAICESPALAVELAYEKAGRVENEKGRVIWKRVVLQTRNQIMAITEESVTEDKNSLCVCLDTMMKYQGVIRNSDYLMAQGQSALEILEDNLESLTVLDLTGCSLNMVLYYVNQDYPVLAELYNGEAVLITGFNELNVVLMDPLTGTLYKKGMNDSTEWFEENGNRFFTYCK